MRKKMSGALAGRALIHPLLFNLNATQRLIGYILWSSQSKLCYFQLFQKKKKKQIVKYGW